MQPVIEPDTRAFIEVLKLDEMIMIFKKKDGFAVRVDFLPDGIPLKTFLHRLDTYMMQIFKRAFRGFYYKDLDERSILHLWYAKGNFKKTPTGFQAAKSLDKLENYPSKPFRSVIHNAEHSEA